MNYITATSTTATSTFAGGLAVETSGLVYDYSTDRVGIGTASPIENKFHVSGAIFRLIRHTLLGNLRQEWFDLALIWSDDNVII